MGKNKNMLGVVWCCRVLGFVEFMIQTKTFFPAVQRSFSLTFAFLFFGCDLMFFAHENFHDSKRNPNKHNMTQPAFATMMDSSLKLGSFEMIFESNVFICET